MPKGCNGWRKRKDIYIKKKSENKQPPTPRKKKKNPRGSAQSICYQFEICIAWVLHWHLVKGYLCSPEKTREDIRSVIASFCGSLVVLQGRINDQMGWVWCFVLHSSPVKAWPWGSVNNLQRLGLIVGLFKDQEGDLHPSKCKKPTPQSCSWQNRWSFKPWGLGQSQGPGWCRCCPGISTPATVDGISKV